MQSREGRRLFGLYDAFADDIFKFCAVFNFIPTWQQKLILDAVQAAADGRGKKRIAVKSGQGPGKTTVAAIVGMWRCLRNYGALTVLTAPTMEQCKENFLKECRRLWGLAEPIIKKLFEVTKTRVIVAGLHDWGIKLKASTKPENAQGKHDDFLTIIIDETSGVDRAIMQQYEGTMTNADALLLCLGNPNTRDCAFFDCFTKDRQYWECITLNAEESPIVSKENIAYIANKYGKDSDVYRVRVLGEFPLMDPNCIMSIEDLEACTKNDMLKCALMATKRGGVWEVAKQFGLDFARYGDDENACYRRSGLAVVEAAIMRKVDPSMLIAASFRQQALAHWTDEQTVYVADATGMGQSSMMLFHNAHKNVYEFHNNGRAMASKEFENKITEAYFRLQAHVKARRCYLPRDPLLLQQLSTRQYFMTKDGKLEVENKDDYKKRGFSSPDRAEAIVECYYDQAVIEGRSASGTQRGSQVMGNFGMIVP